MASSTDRATAVKEFEETKAGVKGLVDSGITSLPAIFCHPKAHLSIPAATHLSIPTVDLSLPRPIAVDLIRSASRDWGFIQLVNHGIPLSTINNTFSAVRSFHELPSAVRSQYYNREPANPVSYFSNVDLFRSAAASWRDTLKVVFGPVRPEPDQFPEVCRAELVTWDERAKEVASEVLGMMCEGLGVDRGRLEEMTCLESRRMVCHYYPPCPEPDQTFGQVDHSDASVLTVLLQDQTGGLQVKRKGEDDGDEFSWFDVKPIPGALVVNVGDLLQIISNDEYTSVPHRVIAHTNEEARISIGIFFNPAKKGEMDFYGPLPELTSIEKPAHYRNITFSEFWGAFESKEIGSKSLFEHFKLP